MQTPLNILASTEVVQKAGLFESLGIDWKMLVLQSMAFLLLLWLLSRFVYPVLNKMLDEREAAMMAGQEAARVAQEQAAHAEETMKALMKDAQKEASEIVATAKSEASDMVSMAEEKASANADRIIAHAQESIAKDIAAAKKMLHNETIDLVAMATEKVVGKTVNAQIDKVLIKEALK
jgi:F-type H+-transporting ATPase subunit b